MADARRGQGVLPATLSQHEHRITVEEAARIIFNTADPDAVQVGEVRALILRGLLPGSRDGRTTTATAVAEYLTAAALYRQATPRRQRGDAESETAGAPRPSKGNRELREMYRGLLKDYFLALIHRRDRRRYSKLFQRAVLAGQVLGLILIVGTLTAVYLGLRPVPEPQEMMAVRTWLGENTKHFRIVRWHPPEPAGEGGGTSIRVIYTYSDTGRNSIHTDRVFRVRGGKVASVNSVE